MDPLELTQNPLAVLTLIAAPALLTNATCTLANSTVNRMLHTRDRMHEFFAESESGNLSEIEASHVLKQVNRLERQAALLLRALYWIYIALGAFAGATLVMLLGEAAAAFLGAVWFRGFAASGILLSLMGVAGLVFGSATLFRSTQISMTTICEEATLIRQRRAQRIAGMTSAVIGDRAF